MAVSNRAATDESVHADCNRQSRSSRNIRDLVMPQVTHMTEVLLVDTGVSDLATLFSGVRPKVEASVLNAAWLPIRKSPLALGRRQEVGAPWHVSFAASDCIRATPDRGSEQITLTLFPEIGA
jgi:hypothetical protein